MSPVANYEWVNPETLAQTRRRLHLKPEDVAEQAAKLGSEYKKDITAKAIESWEAGKQAPALRHLEALSQIYVCPVGWFFLPDIPADSALLDFRGVAPGARIGASGMQTLRRFQELADWAEDVAIQTGQFMKPNIGQASQRDEIEAVVQRERGRVGFDARVRQQWQSNHQAFDWWRRRIEGLGVFCFVMRLPASEVRGASYFGVHGAAFILVNSEDAESATGRMFTLLHEYAHLVLRQSVVCDFRGSSDGKQVEHYANRFAAGMLLDHSELEEHLYGLGMHRFREQWGDSMLDRIREPFFVSRDVISIYLEELGLAPRGFYSSKRSAWASRSGFGRGGARPGRTQAVQRLGMVGNTLARVLSSSQAESAVSVLELAEVLDVKVEKIPAILETFRSAGDDT